MSRVRYRLDDKELSFELRMALRQWRGVIRDVERKKEERHVDIAEAILLDAVVARLGTLEVYRQVEDDMSFRMAHGDRPVLPGDD